MNNFILFRIFRRLRAASPDQIRHWLSNLLSWGWWQRRPLAKLKCWWLLHRVSTTRAHRKRQAKLHALLESGKPITVVFEVTGTSKWKADSLLRLMMNHPRFQPIVWHVPYKDIRGTDRDLQEIEQCRQYFIPLGAKFVNYNTLGDFPEDERPDIIFPNEPYDYLVLRGYHEGMLQSLLCFIPYDFASDVCAVNRNQIITNGSLFTFYENRPTAEASALLMNNKGINSAVTGHAMADAFLFPPEPRPEVWKQCATPMKRVIWAPHWTIQRGSCWIYYGTFLKTGEILLKLAEKYRNQIQFAFKPHPNLYYTLCNHPDWGEERTNAFYAKWGEMPNTQIEEGGYADLFMQSDAMIHDCASFTLEYLFADKPCMFLREPDNHQEYSTMAADCLNAYQIGVTQEEIEAFLQMVLRGEDPKAEVRWEVRKKYLIPPHGQSAAQNIIDCILGKELHG